MKVLTRHSTLVGSIALSSIMASIGLVGGLGIQLVKQELVLFLPLLIALPAMNAMAGDYATLTAAHLADPESYRSRVQKLILYLFLSLPISCAGVIAMSLGVAHLNGFYLNVTTVKDFSLAITITLYAVTILMFGLIYICKLVLQRLGDNIDDTLIPIANTLASVLTLVGYTIVAQRLF